MSEDWSLRPGTQLGSYRITKVLGRGGFGITYQAWDDQLKRTVAIKEYFPHRLMKRGPDGLTVVGPEDPTYRQRLDGFLDEARTLAQFRDPRIVHVHGFHEANNTAYMVMDFAEGSSLRDQVSANGTFSIAEGRAILVDILKGLRVIHARSYLHRDIKPANILRRPDGSILLLDFGSARQAVADQEQDFTVFVSPGYAPMEQYSRGETQGPPTDLYAVGACILYCLTGSSPPEAMQRSIAQQSDASDGLGDILAAIAQRGTGGPELAEVLAWLLEPQASQRPQTADAVLQRLDESVSAIPPAPSGADTLTAPRARSRTDEAMANANAPTVLHAIDLSQLRAIPSRLVDEIRRLLEAAIGERASAVLFEAIRTAKNGQRLLDNLKVQLGDDPRRQATIEQITGLLTAAARKAAESGSVPAQALARTTPPPMRAISGTAAPALPPAPASGARAATGAAITDDETTQHISRELAKHIGPIAGMLVKKLRTKSSSLQDLLGQLEAEIPTDTERQAFRHAMRNLVRP